MGDEEARLRTVVGGLVGKRVFPRSARLFHDLGLGGDDAVELFDAIGRDFGTDLSGFDLSRYFPGETEALAAHWARLLRIGKKRPPLTFGHVLAVVQEGRWIDPPDQSDVSAFGSRPDVAS